MSFFSKLKNLFSGTGSNRKADLLQEMAEANVALSESKSQQEKIVDKDISSNGGDASSSENIETGASTDIAGIVIKEATSITDEFEGIELPSEVDEETPETLVYLGVDFGTSFSKLAYWVDVNDRGVIDFDGKYFIDTAVYIGDDSLSLKNQPDFVELRYFKYEMIPNENPSLFTDEMKRAIKRIAPNQRLKVFARNCSIYFVANLIRMCNEKLQEEFGPVHLSINMGAPVRVDKEGKRVFEEILFCAYRLFLDGCASETISYENLDAICSAYLDDFKEERLDQRFPLNITSEVIAEADYLLSQETYGIGMYVIADIGGGTTDFAFVQKCSRKDYDLIWYSIVPHGIETYKVDDLFSMHFRQSYYDFLFASKDLLGRKNAIDATYLLFGGGLLSNQSSLVINEFRTVFSNFPNLKQYFSLKKDERDFPAHHQASNVPLRDIDKQRLVIACQLSNPNLPEVTTLPPTRENLEQLRAQNKKEASNRESYSDILEREQREKYGN
jgi:hypothetical protein